MAPGLRGSRSSPDPASGAESGREQSAVARAGGAPRPSASAEDPGVQLIGSSTERRRTMQGHLLATDPEDDELKKQAEEIKEKHKL